MADELFDLARLAARQAGDVIMAHYSRGDEIRVKGDGSPLTLADEAAHQAIAAVLGASNIPVVSEEGNQLFMEAQRYWLVDPLDGTKDFIAANDEFTVNIALIEDYFPVLGVVYAPALNEMYAGIAGTGSCRIKGNHRTDLAPLPRSPVCRMAASERVGTD